MSVGLAYGSVSHLFSCKSPFGIQFFFSCSFIGHVTAFLLMNVNRENGVIGMMLEQKKYAVMEIANICLVVHGG